MTDDEIDRLFPHQVILPSECYAATEFRSIHAFCIGMSLADRGHVVMRKAQGTTCFAFLNGTTPTGFEGDRVADGSRDL